MASVDAAPRPSTTAAWWPMPRAAPSGHPGAAPRPARTRPAAPRSPGAGEQATRRWTGATADDAGVAHTRPANATTGTRFRWGVRQLDREPRVAPGLAGRGGTRRGDLGPLLLTRIAAGTGDVLMSRLREGRANTAREQAPPTSWGSAPLEAVRGWVQMQLHNEAIQDGTPMEAPPIPRPSAEADAAPVRLQARVHLLVMASSPTMEAGRHAEITRPQVRRRAEPSPLGPLRRQRRLAGRPDDGPQPGTTWLEWVGEAAGTRLTRWTARIGLGERIATTKTLRRRFFSLAGGDIELFQERLAESSVRTSRASDGERPPTAEPRHHRSGSGQRPEPRP